MSADKSVKKVVLAYSGGLDTSIILKWLQETYGCEVVTFTADLGQGEELEPARKKAEMLGIKEIYIEEFPEDDPWTEEGTWDLPEGEHHGVDHDDKPHLEGDPASHPSRL